MIISCKHAKKHDTNSTNGITKLNYDNYRYIVSVRNITKAPKCKFPREKVYTGLRFNKIIYEDNDFKKIIYPCELQFTHIAEDDIIENNIINIQQYWPHWYKIKVVPFVKK